MAYTARVLAICANARKLFSDKGGGQLTDAVCVFYMNIGLSKLADKGAFQKFGYVNSVADTSEYNLLTTLTDLVRPQGVGYKGPDNTRYRPLTALPNMNRYRNCKAPTNDYDVQDTEKPEFYLVKGSKLYTWPPPQDSVTQGFEVYYDYMPAVITDAVDPPTPAHKDYMYVKYIVYEALRKDRPSRNSKETAIDFLADWELETDEYVDAINSSMGGGVIATDR